jgi:hypothetical protein
MGKLNSPDVSEIQKIVLKLVRSKRFNELTKEEISNLSEFAGIEKPAKENESAKTLFSWIFDNLVKFDKYSSDHSLIDITLFECVINKEAGRSYSGSQSAGILCTLLTRSDLIKAINECLQLRKLSLIEHHDRIEGAVLLIGMAGLKEFEKDLIDICFEKADEDDFAFEHYGFEILAFAFISLIILDSNSVGEVYSRLKAFSAESVKKAIWFYYDLHPEKITDKEIAELHDFFIDYDDALKLSNLAFKVLSKDQKDLNTLISNNLNETGSDFIWGVICPAVYSFKNKKLLQSIIDENDPRKVQRVLISAILEKAEWALPLLMKQINQRDKKKDDYDFRGNLPYYIITAGALSTRECDWLRPFFSDPDETLRVSAILASTGKDQFIGDLKGLKNSKEGLTSASIAFVLAFSEDQPVVYLDSLVLEMGISGLDHGFPPFIYCLLKSISYKIPAELQDIWFMAGPFDYKGSRDFYQAWPYRLINWLFPDKKKRPLPNFISLDEDILERSTTILKGIADNRYTGLLKSLLYTVDSEAVGVVVLSLLIELEQDELSTETKTLKKIFLSERDRPIVFDKDEFIYALLFYFQGKFDRKSEIVSGINHNSEFVDTFLRLLIETGKSEAADTAIEASLKQEESSEMLICEIKRIKSEGQNGSIDKIMFSRLIATNSDKFRSDLLDRYIKPDADESRNHSQSKMQLTDEDIHLLIYLFGDANSSVKVKSLDALASHVDQVRWLKSSINRWFGLKNELLNFPEDLSAAALRAASIIRSEEYLPQFINLASQEDLYSTENGKCLNIIEGILKKNPESKFIMLRADDPDKVKESYNLTVKKEYSLDRDDKSESIKLISIALDKLTDLKYVEEHAGKTLSINHEKDNIDPTLMQKCLTKNEFEKIALYLSVTYTDEASGLIFAEVLDPSKNKPTGEVINAILQGKDFAVFTVSWS